MYPKPSLLFLGETYHLNHPRHDSVWPRSSVNLPTVDLFPMSYREFRFFRGPNFKLIFRFYYLHVSRIRLQGWRKNVALTWLGNKERVMYHSRRKTQDSPSSFSHSNHHGPVVDFVQVVCRLKFGLYLLPENWAPVESKYQKRIRTIDVLITLAFNCLTTSWFGLDYQPLFRKMSPHSSYRKSSWKSMISFTDFSQSGYIGTACRVSSGNNFPHNLSFQNREVLPVGFRSSFRIL